MTALENQYLTKKAVLRAGILFIAFIGIKLVLSRIIPGISDVLFYTIPFLLVVIPAFYKQLGIKKTIAYSALSLMLFTAFVYTIYIAFAILYLFTYNVAYSYLY